MKLGDMTFKQIANVCTNHRCTECPFCKDDASCVLLNHTPSFQNLDMEVNIDAGE